MPRKHFTRSREDRKALMSFACLAALRETDRLRALGGFACDRSRWRLHDGFMGVKSSGGLTPWRKGISREAAETAKPGCPSRARRLCVKLIVFALLAVSRAIYPGGGRTPAFRVVNGGRHAMAGRHFT
jgi:hypothetical protein